MIGPSLVLAKTRLEDMQPVELTALTEKLTCIWCAGKTASQAAYCRSPTQHRAPLSAWRALCPSSAGEKDKHIYSADRAELQKPTPDDQLPA